MAQRAPRVRFPPAQFGVAADAAAAEAVDTILLGEVPKNLNDAIHPPDPKNQHAEVGNHTPPARNARRRHLTGLLVIL